VLFDPTSEEAAILVRQPTRVPIDLLRDVYRSAINLRAMHDLAGGVLRNVGQDQRTGWDIVSERRVEGGLIIRHPNIEPFKGIPSQEMLETRNDLLRKRDLLLLDTDLWELFGLERP
jgi:hypothetical protein